MAESLTDKILNKVKGRKSEPEPEVVEVGERKQWNRSMAPPEPEKKVLPNAKEIDREKARAAVPKREVKP